MVFGNARSKITYQIVCIKSTDSVLTSKGWARSSLVLTFADIGNLKLNINRIQYIKK